MRLLYMVMAAVVLFLFLSFQWAYSGDPTFLKCNLPEPGVVITKTFVEITDLTTNIVKEYPGLNQIVGNEFILYDIGTLTPGKYKFRARWQEAAGWPSDYSLPFQSGKPKPIDTLRIGTIPSVP